MKLHDIETSHCDSFTLINPETDTEIRPDVKTFVTKTSVTLLEPSRFEKFSHWMRLCCAIASLKRVAASFKKTDTESKGWKYFSDGNTAEEVSNAAKFIIHTVQ